MHALFLVAIEQMFNDEMRLLAFFLLHFVLFSHIYQLFLELVPLLLDALDVVF
jgi:hypothetical protein